MQFRLVSTSRDRGRTGNAWGGFVALRRHPMTPDTSAVAAILAVVIIVIVLHVLAGSRE